jgi:hypothetical protein
VRFHLKKDTQQDTYDVSTLDFKNVMIFPLLVQHIKIAALNSIFILEFSPKK